MGISWKAFILLGLFGADMFIMGRPGVLNVSTGCVRCLFSNLKSQDSGECLMCYASFSEILGDMY